MSNDITLCYRNNKNPNDWLCECDYKSLIEADLKAIQLINTNKNIDTRIFSFNKYTPNFYQKNKIKYQLKFYCDIKFLNKSEIPYL